MNPHVSHSLARRELSTFARLLLAALTLATIIAVQLR